MEIIVEVTWDGKPLGSGVVGSLDEIITYVADSGVTRYIPKGTTLEARCTQEDNENYEVKLAWTVY